MPEKKKRAYWVKCTVNLEANRVEDVIVRTTKPHLARQKAEALLRDRGYFHVHAYYCEEVK